VLPEFTDNGASSDAMDEGLVDEQVLAEIRMLGWELANAESSE
jgi:hypothetical protein